LRSIAGGQPDSALNFVKALALATALSLAGPASGLADIRITSSPGGEVEAHLKYFNKVKDSGERVIIDGPCLSACTLVLSTLPRNRICMTSRAVLGFHAPFMLDDNGRTFRTREVTRAMTATYPPAVRTWLKRHGGLTPQLKYLKGKELTAMYRRC
jgi:hypothetical protein